MMRYPNNCFNTAIQLVIAQLLFAFILLTCVTDAVRIPIDERHSFSLTTFDPDGKLNQVERATEAAMQGTPVAVIVRPVDSTIIMTAPQILPSPFMKDDGTSRFVRLTSKILISHSGISADGRILIAAAQRMAVEHEYTFDEEIRLEILLEELSLMLQEYTMKAGVRPFGCYLIVACTPSTQQQYNHVLDEQSSQQSSGVFRIDPSGTVQSLGNYAIINGKWDRDDDVTKKLRDLATNDSLSNNETREAMVSTLKSAIAAQYKRKNTIDETPFSILLASLNEDKFRISRHTM